MNFSRLTSMFPGAKIKTLKTYKDDDQYYMTLVFEWDNGNQVQEYTIPKILLDTSCISVVNRFERDSNYPSEEYFIKFGGYWSEGLPVFPKDGAIFTKKVVKQHVKEMTLEEIEKELGRKIKIISKK